MDEKNIVFIIAVGDKPEYKVSIQSWKRWADKNNCDVLVLDQPIVPMEDMHIIWQRYFLFDIYDANKIRSDQTLIVDADTIVHPDCPNFLSKKNL